MKYVVIVPLSYRAFIVPSLDIAIGVLRDDLSLGDFEWATTHRGDYYLPESEGVERLLSDAREDVLLRGAIIIKARTDEAWEGTYQVWAGEEHA